MRHIGLFVALLSLAVSAAAEVAVPEPEAVNLVSVLKPGEVLRYNVRVQATGTTTLSGASQPTPLDMVLDLVMSYTVGQPAQDGSVQITIASERASAVLGGQKMELPNGFIPKVVVLIDKNGQVTRLFTSDAGGVKLPGLNSRNLILLFRPEAPVGDLKPGTTWSRTVALPPEPDKYDLRSVLEALENVGGMRTARVKTEVTVVPPAGSDYTAKGFTVTNFSLDGARLVKSHAEMTVKMTNKGPQPPSPTSSSETPGKVEAVVKIDIQQAADAEPPAK